MNFSVSAKYIVQLFRFMLLFKIDRFYIKNVTENSIRAIVGWPDDGLHIYDADEEIQEIEWEIQNISGIEDALVLAEVIISEEKIDIDRLDEDIVSLQTILEWDDIRFNNALESLLAIKVDMIDDDEKTDFFFVHF
ncbi:hypothetical protein CH371_01570 [Leptospira wolffii]|uniref:Uncharacterized protein n=1 Tax=Leptospira wolffii TaxID=409998 RepID=A0A2M9ZER7_9LEPT|nr:hypothetical protein [Leptospira wolffii]PJZ66817.1 hypothetical protein CH371_01570 [Leptospira wolffii]